VLVVDNGTRIVLDGQQRRAVQQWVANPDALGDAAEATGCTAEADAAYVEVTLRPPGQPPAAVLICLRDVVAMPGGKALARIVAQLRRG
jgi:hypothetical protein